jgi:hypothetical protein
MNYIEKILLFLGFCVLVAILNWLIKKGELRKNISSTSNLTYDCVPTESGYHNCVNSTDISSNESGIINSNDPNKKGKYNSLDECNTECNKLNNTIQKSTANTFLEYPYDYINEYPYNYINEYPYLYDYRYPYNYIDRYPYTIYQYQRRRGRGGKGDRYGRGGKGIRTESGVGVTINRVIGKGGPDSSGGILGGKGGPDSSGGILGGKGGPDSIIDVGRPDGSVGVGINSIDVEKTMGSKGGPDGSVNIDSIDVREIVGGKGRPANIDSIYVGESIGGGKGRFADIDGVNIDNIDIGGSIGGKGGSIGGKGGM